LEDSNAGAKLKKKENKLYRSLHFLGRRPQRTKGDEKN